MRRMRRIVVWPVALALLAACTGEEAPRIETAEVVQAEVVETVAAAAELEPATAAAALAPATGEVVELLVADGDEVAEGDELLRLDSSTVAAQVEQAEAAVAATDDLLAAADEAGAAGFDLAPLFAVFRAQLDAVFPPVLDGLRTQVRTLEADAAAGSGPALEALAELGRGTPAGLEPSQLELPAVELPAVELPAGVDPEVADDVAAATEDALDVARDAVERATGAVDGVRDAVAEVAAGVAAEAEAARTAQLTTARQALVDAETAYTEARNALVAAEAELAAGTAAATSGQVAGQLAAVDAQRDQAEAALELARSRAQDLTVRAPAGGIVELARGSAGSGAGGLLGDLGALGDLGDLGELGDLGDAGDLLAGGPDDGDVLDAPVGDAGAADAPRTGPLTEGAEVAAGEPLVTVYDLSSFTAVAAVDEIDVVHVAEGQPVTVLVDAFPDAELEGRVDHVAIAPQRQAAGGTVFPVTVVLTSVPDDVTLRVGLTASVEIEVERVDADTAVPTSALLRRGDGEVVYVDRDGVAEAVSVRVLAVGDDAAAVEPLDGDLAAGDRVVTIGVELVEDGDELPG